MKTVRKLEHEKNHKVYDPTEHKGDPYVDSFYRDVTLCDPNFQNEFGRTPLMYACIHKDIYAIRYLLRKGASPSVQDFNGNDMYHYTWNAKIRQKIKRNQVMKLWDDYEDSFDYEKWFKEKIY